MQANDNPGDTSDARLGHGTVQALSAMIKDLEEQLDRMLSINETLERDLDDSRARRKDVERKVDDMAQQLRRAEEEAVAKEGLLAENAHLRAERARLASTVEELTAKVTKLERERGKLGDMVQRVRAGRADALEELHSVEVQFERAMSVVSDLKTRLSVVSEEYDALRSRHKAAEDSERRAEQERDSLRAEVEESRVALEEIRRSLVDACLASQHRRVEDDR